MIPIYSSTGGILRYLDKDLVLAHAGHFDLIYNGRAGKRQKLKGAIWKASQTFDVRPSTRLGMTFEQHLPKGSICYALGGIYGSEPEPKAFY